jgi:hypothetical protein
MEARSQLDLLIHALVLVRKASSAVEAAVGLPATDRAELEEQLEAVRHDLSQVVRQLGGAIPGGSTLAKRPEVKAAAGVVEFLARQGATQLGAVAGVADALRQGTTSRALAQRIERRLAEVGVASREDLAEALGVEPESIELQEAIERALGSGRAEWYGPGVYGVPRSQLEELGAHPPLAAGASEAEVAAEPDEGEEPTGFDHLQAAVSSLEHSLGGLATALRSSGADRPDSDRIRELRRLADEGVISTEEYERKRREILETL